MRYKSRLQTNFVKLKFIVNPIRFVLI